VVLLPSGTGAHLATFARAFARAGRDRPVSAASTVWQNSDLVLQFLSFDPVDRRHGCGLRVWRTDKTADFQPAQSRKALLLFGTASIVLFILLRTTNLYGNPHAPDDFTCGDFHRQTTLTKTVIAFLNTEKYPPSLQFLLVTLGPGSWRWLHSTSSELVLRGYSPESRDFFSCTGGSLCSITCSTYI